MSLFGFFDNEEKEPTPRKPEIVCPTTGNTYNRIDQVPGLKTDTISPGCEANIQCTNLDDWMDVNAPAHAEQAKQVSDDVKEIKEMVKNLLEQNKNLQDRVTELENQNEDQR